MCSCEYKELCYDHNHWATVQVKFDWRQSPQAEVKSMSTLFYNDAIAVQDPELYQYGGMKGGTARLTPAVYQAVAYNNDTETILFRGWNSASTLEAYTRNSSIEEGTQMTRGASAMPRASSTEDQMVILEPDLLWGTASAPTDMTAPGDTTEMTLYPVQYVGQVDITVHNVPNLQYSGQFGGALSGLSPGVMMATGQLSEGLVTQAFSCQAIDESTLYMTFRYFGHCPHRDEGITYPHLLTVYAILADGSKWYHTLDVSEQMHDPVLNPDGLHIYIELDGLPVPKPIVNGSGFHPTIDGWQGEEIEVGM